MSESTYKPSSVPLLYLTISTESGPIKRFNGSENFGGLVTYFSHKSKVNGGYILRFRIIDQAFVETALMGDYFEKVKKEPLTVEFEIEWKGGDKTEKRKAIVTSIDNRGNSTAYNIIDVIAVDPPSYYLMAGNASGKVYTGRVSDVIQKVVEEYSGGKITVDIPKTNDSKYNKHYMMRMGPKQFIKHLLSWSTPFNDSKTRWIVSNTDYKMVIKPQGSLEPEFKRTYLNYKPDIRINHVREYAMTTYGNWNKLYNKIVSYGIPNTTGEYFDPINDKEEKITVIKDTNTKEKLKAQTEPKQTFTKPGCSPEDKAPKVGKTFINPMPEIYSAGEIGSKYKEYITGYARGMYAGLLDEMNTISITVFGDHEWSNSKGLGADVVKLKWGIIGEKAEKSHFDGYYIVVGFEQVFKVGQWDTHLNLIRIDHDADARAASGE